MKTGIILIFTLLFPALGHSQEAKNRYDLLGQFLTPITKAFDPASERRTVTGRFVLESMTGLPEAWRGAALEFALRPPDRLLIRATRGEETVALCRNGASFWVTPGSVAAAWLPMSTDRPNPSKSKALAPIALPLPPQQLAFLPALFEVKEQESEGGMRVLSVKLMPTLARQLKVEAWEARLTLEGSESKAVRLRRLNLHGMGWEIALRVEGLGTVQELPTAIWEPASADVLRFSGADLEGALEAALKKLRERLPQR